MFFVKRLIARIAGTRPAIEELDPKAISSVIIKPWGPAVGDALAHSAHFNQLKKANPNIRTAILVNDRNRELATFCPTIDEIIEDKPWNYIQNRNKWDLYINFNPNYSGKQIILDKILNPKYLLILKKRNKVYYSHKIIRDYNSCWFPPLTTHLANFLEYSVFRSFISPEDSQYQLYINKEPSQNYWQKNKIKVLITPMGSLRRLVVASEIAQLLNSLDSDCRASCSFLLSIPECREEYWAELQKHITEPLDLRLLPKMSSTEFITITNVADLIISIDSGPVHIAGALGKRLLAFYAYHPANFARWQPRMQNNIPYKVVFGEKPMRSMEISRFPIDEANQWLTEQIRELKHKVK